MSKHYWDKFLQYTHQGEYWIDRISRAGEAISLLTAQPEITGSIEKVRQGFETVNNVAEVLEGKKSVGQALVDQVNPFSDIVKINPFKNSIKFTP